VSGPSSDIQQHTVPRQRGHRGSRRRGGPQSSPAPTGPPDLAAVARAAVIGYLRDESAATTERDAAQAGGPGTDATPGDVTGAGTAGGEDAPDADGIVAAPDELAPPAVVLRATAISLATLERIELAAAKLEADIAAARREQAEVRAGAGAAAERAILAAQHAWLSAADAAESSGKARESLRRIGRYMAITIVLVLLQLLIAGVFATSVH
jgi:hypothetical protein